MTNSNGESSSSGGRTLTKANLVDIVYGGGSVSKGDASLLVETVFDTIKEQVVATGNVKISGFGNFVTRDKRSRLGRNPQTGKPIEISARRVLTFKASPLLKATMNGETLPVGDDSDE